MWALTWERKGPPQMTQQAKNYDLLLYLSPHPSSTLWSCLVFTPHPMKARVLGFPGLLITFLPSPHKCPKGRSQVEHLVGWDSGWGCSVIRPRTPQGSQQIPSPPRASINSVWTRQTSGLGALECDILCGHADSCGFWPVCRRQPDSLPVWD